MASNSSSRPTEDWEQLSLFCLMSEPQQVQPEPPPPVLSLIAGTPRQLSLRDYQRSMKNGVYFKIREGFKRILVYGPTGCGKTLVLSSILQDAIARNRRSMLLVHRDFLVEQTIDTLLNLGVAGDAIGIIKAGYKEDRSKPLQICGIQSLQRRDMLEDIGLVVVDECHSCAFWGEYERVKSATPDAIHLGFSASPWRLKSSTEYFGLHFGSIVLGPSIKWLIKHGYLAKPRYFGWGGFVNLTELDTGSDGDYKQGQMEDAFIASEVPQKVVEKVQEFCEGRTGIIFNAGCEQSRLQTQLLNEAGIPTAHVDANTSIDERREIYRQLETGQIRCISSIGCLTEGFDVKSISFIVLARATKSRALYVQICGRGIRSYPGKNDCLILDFGGNVKRHGYLTKNWKIALEPTPPPEAQEMTKECPNCGASVWIFERICPNCGYEFGADGGEEKDEEGFELEFGEMFDGETLEQVRYARSQRKTRFSKKQPPDKLWDTFRAKFGDEVLVADWLFGAIFGGIDNEYNRQRFLEYLEGFGPRGKREQYRQEWLNHHLEAEFGKPGRSYRTGRGRHRTAKTGRTQLAEWWEVLGVAETAEWGEIKDAYRSLAKQYHPDSSDWPEEEATERMKLINLAFDRAKAARQ